VARFNPAGSAPPGGHPRSVSAVDALELPGGKLAIAGEQTDGPAHSPGPGDYSLTVISIPPSRFTPAPSHTASLTPTPTVTTTPTPSASPEATPKPTKDEGNTEGPAAYLPALLNGDR
jgi:hypothetical protein